MKLKKWLGLSALVAIAAVTVVALSAPSQLSQWLSANPLNAPVPDTLENPVSQPTRSPTSVPTPPLVDQQQIFAHVQALNYERSTVADRAQSRAYLRQTLESYGWSPREQTFAAGINLLAQRPGTEPRAGKIIVGAHYDTVSGSPGADDNASGVASVLEVARLLGPVVTPRTLEIVLFDAEEQGLLGSYDFASRPANLEDLQGVVVLEMVGYTCKTPGCQSQPEGLPLTPPSEVGDFLAIVGDAEHLPLLQTFEQVRQPHLPALLNLSVPLKGVLTPDLLRSDHSPFWYQDVGAVMVTDTAFFRNPHYHQASDTPDTLDPQFLADTTQLVVNAVQQLLLGRDSLVTAAPENRS